VGHLRDHLAVSLFANRQNSHSDRMCFFVTFPVALVQAMDSCFRLKLEVGHGGQVGTDAGAGEREHDCYYRQLMVYAPAWNSQHVAVSPVEPRPSPEHSSRGCRHLEN
jgi:hypothetical protein